MVNPPEAAPRANVVPLVLAHVAMITLVIVAMVTTLPSVSL